MRGWLLRADESDRAEGDVVELLHELLAHFAGILEQRVDRGGAAVAWEWHARV